MFDILVVDDNDSIRKLIEAYLVRAGYHVVGASDGVDAMRELGERHIDLMIADIMMPRMDGYTLTRDLRDAGYTFPILMVTAKERIEDKVQGFRAGTDDYMVKPIDFEEMLLRIEALLRRARISAERRIVAGDVVLDYDALTVSTPGETVTLPQKEFYLLFKLLSQPGRIFTRFDLMEEIWGFDSESDERTVDVHIKRLRDRFGHLDAFQIVTVRGLGYKVEKSV